MSINDIIIYIMAVFMVIGVIDKIIGNKFGFGDKFEEGIMAMGTLTLSMVGIISLAPVLANLLSPLIVPLYKALGSDPAMFAGTLLACDMGGYPLAQQLAENPDVIPFAGLILGSMMGATIVFTIPVGLGIINKEDHKFLAKGVLAGIVTIPIGAFIGGLLTGLSPLVILSNLTPIIIVAVLIALGLKLIPEKMITGFIYFGKFVTAMSLVGLGAIIVETLTGLVLIPGLAPISDGVSTVGAIAIVLVCAYPLVHFITKVFKTPLMKVGSLLGIGEVSAAGMVATLANNIPMFGMLKDMDDRGKVVNVAFSVSAAFVFGDHLGFVAGVDKNTILAMIVGKLIAGITAVALACLITPKSKALNE